MYSNQSFTYHHYWSLWNKGYVPQPFSPWKPAWTFPKCSKEIGPGFHCHCLLPNFPIIVHLKFFINIRRTVAIGWEPDAWQDSRTAADPRVHTRPSCQTSLPQKFQTSGPRWWGLQRSSCQDSICWLRGGPCGGWLCWGHSPVDPGWTPARCGSRTGRAGWAPCGPRRDSAAQKGPGAGRKAGNNDKIWKCWYHGKEVSIWLVFLPSCQMFGRLTVWGQLSCCNPQRSGAPGEPPTVRWFLSKKPHMILDWTTSDLLPCAALWTQ